MNLTRLELHLSLQIHVPCDKCSVVYVVVHSLHRNTQLRMVCQNNVRGLSLHDQRMCHIIDAMYFSL